MGDILFWMENSALGQSMRDSVWLFPATEILHFIGLSIMIGSLLVVDCRLLGLSRHVSLQAVYKVLPLSLLGFGINLVTGILFCFADPFRYYPNTAFRIKMFLILLAGLNVLWFKFAVHDKSLSPSEADNPRMTAKMVAALSLIIWFGVIVFGRLIPYL